MSACLPATRRVCCSAAQASLPPTVHRFALPPPLLLLLQERKSLIGQKLNEKHNNWGSLLLGLGVTISVSGAFNTFLRTGVCVCVCVCESCAPGPLPWLSYAVQQALLS